MSSKRDGVATIGAGVAACAVCCAGPVIGFLGALGVGAAAGLAFGIVGLVVATVVSLAYLRRRRHRQAVTCAAQPEVSVTMSSTRVSS